MNTHHDEIDPAERDAMRALLLDHARSDIERAPGRETRHRILGIAVGITALTAVTAGALAIAFGGIEDVSAPADPVSSIPPVVSTVVNGVEVQQAGGTTLFATTSDNQMQALLFGSTIRLDDGCFVAQAADGTTTTLVFPKGTRLFQDGMSAEVPGLGMVADGDALRGGGGVVPAAEMSGPCATGGDVIMWQSTGVIPSDSSQ